MLFPRLLTKISTYVHDHCYLLFKINIQTHDVFRCSWILISKFLPGYSSRNLSSHGMPEYLWREVQNQTEIGVWSVDRTVGSSSQLGDLLILSEFFGGTLCAIMNSSRSSSLWTRSKRQIQGFHLLLADFASYTSRVFWIWTRTLTGVQQKINISNIHLL